jgi:hypothetical protein
MSSSFVIDPFEAVRLNNEHRTPSATGDLFPLDQVRDHGTPMYPFLIPTFVPKNWQDHRPGPLPTQAEYDTALKKAWPVAVRVLRRINDKNGAAPKVILAGGAAASPMYDVGVTAGDADFFVVGADGSDRAGLWARAHEIFRVICEEAYAAGAAKEFPRGQRVTQITQMASPGLLTLVVHLSEHHSKVKFQLILRAYETSSAVLHGFDIPSCSVMYDGYTCKMTSLAKFAHLYRVNLVVPLYRSTTYEKRLAKYFLSRGFGLGLLHLRPGLIKVGEDLPLAHLTLHPTEVVGNLARGRVTSEVPQEPDYEPTLNSSSAKYVNLAQVAKTRTRFVIIERSHSRAYEDGKPGWLPISKWYTGAGSHEPTFEEIFPLTEFKDCVTRTIAASVDGRHHPHVTHWWRLFKYMGMTKEEITGFDAKLTALQAKKGQKSPDRAKTSEEVAKLLQPFRQRMTDRYDECRALPLDWWIISDPTRQHTSSLNPRMEDPAEWYGAERVIAAAADHRAPGSVDAIETLTALIAKMRLNGRHRREAAARKAAEKTAVVPNRCPVCLKDVQPGERGTLVLPCGHVLHWNTTDCSGFLKWTGSTMMGDAKCPVCRASVKAELPKPKADAAVPAAATADDAEFDEDEDEDEYGDEEDEWDEDEDDWDDEDEDEYDEWDAY